MIGFHTYCGYKKFNFILSWNILPKLVYASNIWFGTQILSLVNTLILKWFPYQLSQSNKMNSTKQNVEKLIGNKSACRKQMKMINKLIRWDISGNIYYISEIMFVQKINKPIFVQARSIKKNFKNNCLILPPIIGHLIQTCINLEGSFCLFSFPFLSFHSIFYFL